MTKAVDDMTPAEVAEVRAEIARQRGKLPQTLIAPDLSTAAPLTNTAPASEPETGQGTDTTPAPWPHEYLDFQGMMLQVRTPGEAALVAISMTGSPSLTPDMQMRIFTKFLENHMSPKTFGEVIEAMLNPDSGISLQSLIKALADMPR